MGGDQAASIIVAGGGLDCQIHFKLYSPISENVALLLDKPKYNVMFKDDRQVFNGTQSYAEETRSYTENFINNSVALRASSVVLSVTSLLSPLVRAADGSPAKPKRIYCPRTRWVGPADRITPTAL